MRHLFGYSIIASYVCVIKSFIMTWKKANNPVTVKHNDMCTMAFGRWSPVGCCPRCDELHNGATARAGWNDAKLKADAERAEQIRAHFAPGGRGYELNQKGLGYTDTAFQW